MEHFNFLNICGLILAAMVAIIGDAQGGMNKLIEMFTPKSGTNIAGMLSAFTQTDAGKQLFEKLVKPSNVSSAPSEPTL